MQYNTLNLEIGIGKVNTLTKKILFFGRASFKKNKSF